MKRLGWLIVLFLVGTAHADYVLPADSTSQMLDVFVQDSSSSTGTGLTGLAYNTSGLTCYYHRSGSSSATSISLASSTLGTYTSGCFKEVDSSHQPGVYQICPPTGALASGANYVTIYCQGATNMAPMAARIQIAPEVNLADGAITPLKYESKTAQSVDDTHVQLASSENFSDHALANNVAVTIVSATGGAPGVGEVHCILDNVGSTDTVEISGWTNGSAPTGTIKYALLPAPNCIGDVGDIELTAIQRLLTTDTQMSTDDVQHGSFVDLFANYVFNLFVSGVAGNDFVSTATPLRYSSTDYKDPNFGFSNPGTFFLFNGQLTGCSADSCRVNGISSGSPFDIDAALITENYTGGGGCGTLHQTVFVQRGSMGDDASTFATNLFNILSTVGGPCTLSSLTCENFKQSYMTENGAANYTITGLTGWENGGTITVVSGFTSPQTLDYDPVPPTFISVNLAQISGTPADQTDPLSSLPNANGSFLDKFEYMYESLRNKKTSTSSTETLYKDDGTTSLGTATVSDDGTTFTRGKVN